MSTPAPFTGRTVEDLQAHLDGLRQQMRAWRKVVLSRDGAQLLDVNRTAAAFPRITYGHPLLVPLLRLTGATFDPATVDQPPPNPEGIRDHGCTARYPWGQDRVL